MTSLKQIPYVPRVNQLDAVHLNKNISRLIRDNLLNNLQSLSPTLFVTIQPEVDLLVQSAIWFGSIGRHCSSFGQQLLALGYVSERLTLSRMTLHFALTILPKYVKNNAEYRLSNWNLMHKSLQWLENAALVLSVLNFFRFLKTGKKPSLIDYLLNLDYISLRANQKREIGYKHLTRELMWGGFMELLGLVLPIINFQKIQRLFRLALYGKPNANFTSTLKNPKFELETCCVYCGDRPTLPHHIGCEHIYCYYCIEANILTDSRFSCFICGKVCSKGVLPLSFTA